MPLQIWPRKFDLHRRVIGLEARHTFLLQPIRNQHFLAGNLFVDIAIQSANIVLLAINRHTRLMHHEGR